MSDGLPEYSIGLPVIGTYKRMSEYLVYDLSDFQ